MSTWSDKHDALLSMLKHVSTVQEVIVSAIHDKDPRRADEILAGDLQTTLARAAGEARMARKVAGA